MIRVALVVALVVSLAGVVLGGTAGDAIATVAFLVVLALIAQIRDRRCLVYFLPAVALWIAFVWTPGAAGYVFGVAGVMLTFGAVYAVRRPAQR